MRKEATCSKDESLTLLSSKNSDNPLARDVGGTVETGLRKKGKKRAKIWNVGSRKHHVLEVSGLECLGFLCLYIQCAREAVPVPVYCNPF